MDAGKGQGAYGGGQGYPGRRTREERRSLSESLADGTSKFFSSMVAKKNGLFNDLSSKIENTFAPKTDTISNSTGSDGSVSPPSTPTVVHGPPPRPPPPKRLPSMGSSQEKGNVNVMKRMASMPAYTRTDSKPDYTSDIPATRGQMANHKGANSEERFSVNGMNISFDEPIYNNQRESVPSTVSGVTAPTHQGSSDTSYETRPSRTRHASGSSSEPTSHQPKPAPRSQKATRNSERSSPPIQTGYRSDMDNRPPGEDYGYVYGHPTPSSSEEWKDKGQSSDSRRYEDRRELSDSSTGAGSRGQRSASSSRSNTGSDHKPGGDSGGSDSAEDPQTRQKAPKFTTTKRRSSTVDEMLFDDFVEPAVDEVISTVDPPENLISFEPDSEVEPQANSPDSSSYEENDQIQFGASVDSSDAEFGGAPVHRSASVGSAKSWSSNYSLDSQPDDVTLECMEFMKSFVDKVFHNGEEISQTEKAKFGELCQYFPGRLWFSRYVNSQRVHNKKVTEPIFFRLMQYFAVCLFECNEAEDFSPAKTLMNMCFTFYHEAPSPQGEVEKVFLYTYMREQPIWQSLRFWNAAYFDAVQGERSRRPMPTNSDGNETMTDDKQFQENITFGQLGTFACNMRAFGLSKELCLEFLRKQSTIANLRKDQVRLLRENIERVKET